MDEKLMSDAKKLLAELESKKGFKKKMIIGLDGFVDEIVHAVDKRQDFDTFTRITKIADLGERILKASGLSTNIEFVTVQTKLGGNGPILANALIEYGVGLTYIGAIGESDVHPVFKQMAEKSEAVYLMSDPGHTDALEFEDGKLLLGKLTVLNSLTWERFKKIVGSPEKIAALVSDAHLFGMENWTMIPKMNEVWEGLITEVFPLIKGDKQSRIAFFDLADPEKRTKEDILSAMRLITKFGDKFNAVLGLNEKELFEIAEVFGYAPTPGASRDEKLESAAQFVYKEMGIYSLVVHAVKEALCIVGGNYYHTHGPYCPKPVLTTGAGDNFNAGLCLGLTLGLDPQSAIVLGVATSGFYVRNAKSPTFEDMIGFLGKMAAGEDM